MSEQDAVSESSDYDTIGGGTAVSAVVDRFYALVLDDERLAPFFTDTDLPRLKRHQVLLISQVLGGPAEYDGRDLREAHRGLGIGDGHFDAVVVHLVQALREAGVGEEIIGKVGATLSETRSDIVADGIR